MRTWLLDMQPLEAHRRRPLAVWGERVNWALECAHHHSRATDIHHLQEKRPKLLVSEDTVRVWPETNT